MELAGKLRGAKNLHNPYFAEGWTVFAAATDRGHDPDTHSTRTTARPRCVVTGDDAGRQVPKGTRREDGRHSLPVRGRGAARAMTRAVRHAGGFSRNAHERESEDRKNGRPAVAITPIRQVVR